MISRCQNVACHRRGERPFIEAGRNGLQRDSDREKGERERLLRVTITSRATRHCLGLSTLLVGGFSRFPGEEGKTGSARGLELKIAGGKATEMTVT